MVQLSRQGSPAVYQVFDGECPIGLVIAPAGEPLLRAGAATVLLRRDTGTAEVRAA